MDSRVTCASRFGSRTSRQTIRVANDPAATLTLTLTLTELVHEGKEAEDETSRVYRYISFGGLTPRAPCNRT